MNHTKEAHVPLTLRTPVVLLLLATISLVADAARADEAPISGKVKAVDVAAKTLTLDVASKGKTREVTVHLKPGAKVVRFARATESGKTGFVEQEVALVDVKPGWTVSATTKHEDGHEVAEIVKVVLER
jgi:hypothetical protein